MWRAYVDESEIRLADGRRSYTLAAALVTDEDAAEVRHQMRALHRTGKPKLHWFRLADPDRDLVVKAVAAQPALHVVVVRSVSGREESERARRKTFARLLHELECREVHRVVMESRQRKQDDLDVVFLRGLQSSRQICPEIRLSHVAGPREPLLWVPDVVAGAASSAVRGEEGYLDVLRPVLDLVSMEL